MKKTVILFFIFFFFVSCNSERTAVSVYKSQDKLAALGYEFNSDEFLKAIKEKKADIVKLFIDAGMNPNTTFVLGNHTVPAVFFALETEDELMFQVFLHSKADLNASVDGLDLIAKAASKSSPEIISLIIKSGADINRKGYNGLTPLMVAIENGNNGAAWLFIQSGADLNVGDVYGITALMRALEKGNIDIVREMIKKGADVNAKTKHGTLTSKFIGEKESNALRVLMQDAGAQF